MLDDTTQARNNQTHQDSLAADLADDVEDEDEKSTGEHAEEEGEEAMEKIDAGNLKILL